MKHFYYIIPYVLFVFSQVLTARNRVFFMPEAVCTNATIFLDVNGSAELDPALVDGGSTVPADHTLDVRPNIFDCSHVGTPQTVLLSVLDRFGNTQSACNAIVNISDNVAPIALCQSTSIALDVSGSATVNAIDIDAGSSDNCGIGNLSVSPATFNCNDLGIQPVSLNVTDVNGNSNSCSTTITIIDNTPPALTCAITATVPLNVNGEAIVDPFTVLFGLTDNCGVAFPLTPVVTYTCSDVGIPQNYNLSVTDNNGNTSTCNNVLTIVDNIAPTAVCQNVTIQLDNNSQASITANDINNNSVDNCGIGSLAVSQTLFDCSNVVTNNTVTLTVTDINGNASTCTATVTVEDNIPPITLCQNATISVGSNGTVALNSVDVDGGSNDNCAIANISVSPSSFNCNDIGTPQVVTLTVTDVNSNAANCNATVTVVDNTPPVLTCAVTATVPLNVNGEAIVDPFTVLFGLTDNCGVAFPFTPVVTYTCSDVGTPQNYNLSVTDNNGNTSICNNVLTIVDNIAPTANCQDITIQIDNNSQASISPNDVDNNSTDNCGIASLSLSQTIFDCSHVLSSNTVTLTVTDVNGNASTCTANITVEDNLAPIALCQNATVSLGSGGTSTISSSLVDGGTNDNCAIANISVSPSSFDCNDIGVSQTVTLTANDVNGNANTCTATVTVEDNMPPTVNCQSTHTVQLNANGIAVASPFGLVNSVSDNCGNPPFPINSVFFDCNDVGQSTATFSTTDAAGNVGTCTVIVDVMDGIAPTISCANITLSAPPTGSIGITPENIDGSNSTDNCGIATKVVIPNIFGCSDAGSNTVTLTVTDVNNNVSTCTATVEVVCSVLPVEWGTFIAYQLEQNVVLEWMTFSETQNDRFVIEHQSKNGDFSDIGQLPGKGNTTQQQQYRFLHRKPTVGSNYYRIRQVDFDGEFSRSAIVEVNFEQKETKALMIYPNPVKGWLNYSLRHDNQETLSVSIFNKQFQKVFGGPYTGRLNVVDWPSGLYWLIIYEGVNRLEQKAFVIK